MGKEALESVLHSGPTRVGAGGMVQVAYAVDDVRSAAASHARRFGSGPWYVSEHIALASVVHEGVAATFDHSSAYGQWGEVMVELLCVHGASPASLERTVRGAPGIHHVACFATDLVQTARVMSAAGCRQIMLASTSGGQRFAFHVAAELGHLIEVYQDGSSLRAFYSAVAVAAAGWDGRDPVREIIDLVL